MVRVHIFRSKSDVHQTIFLFKTFLGAVRYLLNSGVVEHHALGIPRGATKHLLQFWKQVTEFSPPEGENGRWVKRRFYEEKSSQLGNKPDRVTRLVDRELLILVVVHVATEQFKKVEREAQLEWLAKRRREMSEAPAVSAAPVSFSNDMTRIAVLMAKEEGEARAASRANQDAKVRALSKKLRLVQKELDEVRERHLHSSGMGKIKDRRISDLELLLDSEKKKGQKTEQERDQGQKMFRFFTRYPDDSVPIGKVKQEYLAQKKKNA